MAQHSHDIIRILGMPAPAGNANKVLTLNGTEDGVLWTTPVTGVTSLSAIGAVPNANAGTITGSVLNFQPASLLFGGVVTTLTQSFAGAKTFALPISTGINGTSGGGLLVNGSTSGAISVLPQAASGTFNFNLPITAGSTGQVLTSQGGGATAMTWTTPTTGTVTSVGLSIIGPATPLFTVSGSPVTSTGTLTGTLANQTNGTVFCVPVGSAQPPSFNTTVDIGVAGSTAGKINIANSTSGVVTIQNTVSGGSSNWNFNLPTNAGSFGQTLISQAGGVNEMIWGFPRIPINFLDTATGTNTIDNLNLTQAWSWNSLGAGVGLYLSTVSTTASGNNQRVLLITSAGANSNSTQTTYCAVFDNSHTGTSSTNIAASFSATGGSNNYAIIVPVGSGRVGIGTTAPTEILDVNGNIKFSGALMPNNLAGTTGQVLTSQGAGTAPIWSTVSGGTITADNGLTMSTSTNVQLGGSLLATTTIAAGASFELLITGTSTNTFHATTTNNKAIFGEASGAGAGVVGSAGTSGVGVQGFGTSGAGVMGIATTGIGGTFQTDSGTAYSIIGLANPSSTNTVANIASFRRISSGTAANGIGGLINIMLEATDGNIYDATTIQSTFTNATTGSRTSSTKITGVDSAVAKDLIVLNGNGSIQLPEYGSGTFTGTETYALGVDSSGNVIETNNVLTEGSYTPTVGTTANVASSTAFSTRYARTGNKVDVWGEISFTPTVGLATTTADINLPITSTLVNTRDLAGTASSNDYQGVPVRILGVTSTGSARFSFMPLSTTALTYSFHFTYFYVTP